MHCFPVPKYEAAHTHTERSLFSNPATDWRYVGACAGTSMFYTFLVFFCFNRARRGAGDRFLRRSASVMADNATFKFTFMLTYIAPISK
jgi:hypothetical protein